MNMPKYQQKSLEHKIPGVLFGIYQDGIVDAKIREVFVAIFRCLKRGVAKNRIRKLPFYQDLKAILKQNPIEDTLVEILDRIVLQNFGKTCAFCMRGEKDGERFKRC